MRRSNQSCLALLSMLTLVSLGCCGPLACGPAGHRGPVGLATPACGGCGDCNGCGELYVDPWINEPTSCSDPCDSCGNYNGQTCGSCRPVFSGIASLWGYRYDAGCGCGQHHRGECDESFGGCDGISGAVDCDCGGHGHVIDGGQMMMDGGHRVYDQPYAEPLPPPQPTPIEDEQDEELMESRIPNGSQQIFRRRGTVVQGAPRNRY